MQVISESQKTSQPSRAQLRAILERIAAPVGSALPLPKLLFVLAHPDDEVLAAGGRLERMSASHLVTVTDGAPLSGADAQHHGFVNLDAYRAARQRELASALADAQLSNEFVLPFAAQVADQAACLHLVPLSRAVAELILERRPEAVVTHPYEGGHPDHDACAFAVHAAVRLVTAGNADRAPVIVEAPFYNAGENGSMRTGTFLEVADVSHVSVRLSAEEADRKQRRIRLFSSQAETLAQFGTEYEQFRVAPAYDFTGPPHAGTLLYEQFSWGVSGARFRELAADALATLFPGPLGEKAKCRCL